MSRYYRVTLRGRTYEVQSNIRRRAVGNAVATHRAETGEPIEYSMNGGTRGSNKGGVSGFTVYIGREVVEYGTIEPIRDGEES